MKEKQSNNKKSDLLIEGTQNVNNMIKKYNNLNKWRFGLAIGTLVLFEGTICLTSMYAFTHILGAINFLNILGAVGITSVSGASLLLLNKKIKNVKQKIENLGEKLIKQKSNINNNGLENDTLQIEKNKNLSANKSTMKQTPKQKNNLFTEDVDVIDPLDEIPEPIIELYGIEAIYNKNIYFNNEEVRDNYIAQCNLNYNQSNCKIEYFAELAGQNDVIRKTILERSYIMTVLDSNHYAIYNTIQSKYYGETVWDIKTTANPLKDEFDALKNRGIELRNDIYSNEKVEQQKVLKMKNRKLNESNSH